MFNSKADMLVNPVNCVGVMGAGLALQFKKRYPSMYKEYAEKCKSGEIQLGKPYIHTVDDIKIVSFPTKHHWRNKSKLEDVNNGLAALAGQLKCNPPKMLAIPAIGCGLGGLKWKDVHPLILEHLSEICELDIYPPM
jgi:O-acetyl-ADP-ribose deacetylase (regulator of RNase III)